MEVKHSAKIDHMLLIKFIIENDHFGINIASVREIIEITKITAVPKTPDYFVGIINLRGEIISVIDMRKRFGLPEKEYDEFSRIAVIFFKGGLIGLIVDDVNEVVRVSNTSISRPPSILKNIKTNYLKGVVETDAGEMILLLNLEEVINLREFEAEKEEKKFVTKDFEYEKVEKKVEEVQIISFYIQDELYAINIQDAEEILLLPEITPIPQAPDFIKGVISLRGNIIPIVDLHIRFDYEEINITDKTSVIIVNVGGCLIGFIVDAISEIVRVPKKLITIPPPTLSKTDVNQLYGIIKLEHAKKSRIVSYISLQNLFTEEEIALLSEVMEDNAAIEKEKASALKDESFVVVDFRVGDDVFTIPVNIIVEISKYPELTRVPNAPSFIEGVINLRGEVVFLIDLRERFGFPRKKVDDGTRVIIVDINGMKTGLVVDEVYLVTAIFKSQIEPAPKIVSNIENEYISSVIKLKDSDNIMIMLNLQSLLSRAEIEAIKSVDLKKNGETQASAKSEKKPSVKRKTKKEKAGNAKAD